MDNSNYLFSLKIDGTELAIGGDKDFVESYLKKWLVLFQDKLPSELIEKKEDVNSHDEEEHQPKVRKTSIGDFIKLKSPKTYNDLVLVVCFYFERYEAMENIGVPFETIASFIAKIPPHPKDEEIQSNIDQLLEQGFIQLYPATEENPKYQVTFTGEQCVKQGFE